MFDSSAFSLDAFDAQAFDLEGAVTPEAPAYTGPWRKLSTDYPRLRRRPLAVEIPPPAFPPEPPAPAPPPPTPPPVAPPAPSGPPIPNPAAIELLARIQAEIDARQADEQARVARRRADEEAAIALLLAA